MLVCCKHYHLSNLCQAFIILQEEGEVLIRDIHFGVASKLAMLFFCISPPTECILEYLRTWAVLTLPIVIKALVPSA